MFSRLTGGRSFYEELHRNHDDLDDEERIGLDLDRENLNQNFQDEDLDHAEGLGDSRVTVQSHRDGASPLRGWRDDEADNDVPASLLVEPSTAGADPSTQPKPRHVNPPHQTPIPGPSNRRTRAQWEATQAQQRLHRDDTFESSASTRPKNTPPVRSIAAGNVKEKTMWKWANVTNIDAFLTDVYNYYKGAGIWCILLDRALMLVQIVFVAVLLTFLTQCVDYNKITHDTKLSDVVIPSCTSKMSWKWNFLIWMWTFYFVIKVIQYAMDLRTLFWMRDFYTHLLNVSDDDMQTISWQDIVAKLMALRDSHPIVAPAPRSEAQRKFMKVSRERMDAHDIANRLMRKENYIIAMFNKDLLDLSPPLPFLRNYQFYSKHLEWWLWLSIIDFVFQPNGTVRQEFLQASRRGQLSQKLKERFVTYAIFSVFFSPVTAVYNLIVHVFKYFNEYKTTPARLGARAYTPLAEWKFREFNELEHFFKDRVNMSYPFATHYIDQFPKLKTELITRTVAFISGALTAILVVVTMFDNELGFEITPGRTVVFYTTLFSIIWAGANASLSDETKVFDPEYTLKQVIEYTHYQPDHWKGRLHSYEVKTEFSQLYKPRVVIFLEEIVGILMTPLILAFCLPKCADQIIDFFREFTIHVDGVGYVCYFAEFKFNAPAGGKRAAGEADDVRDDYYATKHGKMHSSYINFLDNYVVNPKMGITGSQRAMFHPPPAFPGLQSPTLAADMQSSRLARSERARSRPPHSDRTPRFRPHLPQPSPMASMLLDPHHQPTASSFAARTAHTHRTARSGYVGDGIIEESEDEDEPRRTANAYKGRVQDVEADELAQGLGESAWETSPMKGMSRENSGLASEEETPGVLGLVRQLQQAQMDNRR